MKRRVAIGLLLVGAVACAAAYLARGPLLTAAGSFVVSAEAPRPADAIVVLSGSLPDRILEAVDLFQEGFAPRIVLTEESSRPGLEVLRRRGADIPEKHDLNLSIAEQLGVPRAVVVLLEAPANSTISEADVVLEYATKIAARRILVVTSKMHSYRAGLIYRARAGEALEVVALASRHDPYEPGTWWHSRGYVRRLVFEYQKLLVFWLRDRWLGVEAHRVREP